MPDDLQPGLYDELVDLLLRARIDALDAARMHASAEPVDAAELPERIADLVRRWTEHALAVTKDADRGHTAERIAASVLAALASVEPAVHDVASPLPLPVSRLLAVELARHEAIVTAMDACQGLGLTNLSVGTTPRERG